MVLKALGSEYVPAPIREARERQDEYLLQRFRGQPLAIADVGCGTGYHGSLFAPHCRAYHGYEIAPDIAAVARERWQADGLDNAELFLGDVAAAEPPASFYDVVWCLYFTPGNIRDSSATLDLYTEAYLDRNPAFIAAFSRFHRALKPGGLVFLTVYRDVPEAEAAQREFYRHTGQTVVTPLGSRFVATAEHFWSARWTRDSVLSNLLECGFGAKQVRFHELNPIAWLVEARKPGDG